MAKLCPDREFAVLRHCHPVHRGLVGVFYTSVNSVYRCRLSTVILNQSFELRRMVAMLNIVKSFVKQKTDFQVCLVFNGEVSANCYKLGLCALKIFKESDTLTDVTNICFGFFNILSSRNSVVGSLLAPYVFYYEPLSWIRAPIQGKMACFLTKISFLVSLIS